MELPRGPVRQIDAWVDRVEPVDQFTYIKNVSGNSWKASSIQKTLYHLYPLSPRNELGAIHRRNCRGPRRSRGLGARGVGGSRFAGRNALKASNHSSWVAKSIDAFGHAGVQLGRSANHPPALRS